MEIWDSRLNGKRILVNVSGGADSAMGLYQLCSELGNQVEHIIPFTSVDTVSPVNKECAEFIVEWVKDITGYPLQEHVWHYYTSTEDVRSKSPYRRIWFVDNKHTYDYNLVFETSAPLDIPELQKNRPNRDINQPKWRVVNDLWITYLPWAELSKKDVADMYASNPIFEELFLMTNSCTKVGMKFKDDPCKKCWWCREKYWAFNRYDWGQTNVEGEV